MTQATLTENPTSQTRTIGKQAKVIFRGRFRGDPTNGQMILRSRRRHTRLLHGCSFNRPNVSRHLRRQPHLMNEASIKQLMLEKRREAGKPERHHEQLACPVLGEILPNFPLACSMNPTLQLDQRLVKHGLSHGNPKFEAAMARSPQLTDVICLGALAIHRVSLKESFASLFIARQEGRHGGKSPPRHCTL